MAAARVSTSDPARALDDPSRRSKPATAPFVPFELFETLRWSAGEGFYLLDLHLARLAASAAHLGFQCDLDAARQMLATCSESLGDGVFRVRLWLNPAGQLRTTAVTTSPPSSDAIYRFILSEQRIDSGDDIVYHKTTRREVYENELARLSAATGCDEVIFCNERGELTEGTRTNLFLERAGRLLTPPVACGLLNGTLRQALFNDPETAIEECVLFPGDLATADCVFLGNSVRGLVRALPVAETSP